MLSRVRSLMAESSTGRPNRFKVPTAAQARINADDENITLVLNVKMVT